MPNNLQALEALKQSANKQEQELQSTIKEIHTKSLQELNKSLTSVFDTKLNGLESSIQKNLLKSVQSQIKTKNWIIITLTALVTMTITIPSTWLLKPKEVVVQTEAQTQFKEIDNPKLIQENRSVHAQNEKLAREIQANENKIKLLQAENKDLKAWSIPDRNHGTTPDGKKWMLTSEVTRAENGKSWALVEK